jgi:hypothetical protein
MASTERSPSAAWSLAAGAVAGLAAYLLGYLATYLVTADRIRDSLASAVVEFAAGEPVTWKLVGWVFYNEHFVRATVPGLTGRNAVDLVAEVEAFSAVLYLVPPLLLLVAGVAAVRTTGTTGAKTGATRGALVVAGYLPAAVAGAFLFVVAAGDLSAGPNAVTAALLAGGVYPVVFGALGGAAAGATG